MAYDSINTKTAKEINKRITFCRNKHSLILAKNERWYIGISKNPEQRKKQHEKKANDEGFHVSFFESFNARTIGIALAVETYWHELGMLETDKKGNYTDESIFVYIFKKYPLFVKK